MKRISFVCLLLFCLNNLISAQTTDINNVRYSFSGAYAIVSKFLGGEEACVIPEKIECNGLEYTVTTIGDESFMNTYVTEVILSETITSIGKNAFKDCRKLIKIKLPSSLIIIKDGAFCFCDNLTQIIIPEYVSELGGYNTFAGCSTLRTLIYLGKLPPMDWIATSMTYVPDKQSYSSPLRSIHNAQVIEMITFNNTEYEYTGSAHNPTWTNNVDGYSASLSMPNLSGEVGSHEEWIPVTFTKDGESFTANVVYRYTIRPATLTAKVENVSREYGEDNPLFNITYSGFVNGEDESIFSTIPTISTTATNTSNIGDYPIIVSGGVATNYNMVYEPGVLTVTKAPLSAKVNDVTKVYGSNNPSFSIEYYGLKNGETIPTWTTQPTFQTEATKQSGVGQYAVNAINGVPKNYDLGAITPGTLTITPAPLTIKASNATRQYYNENPTFSYTCSGFVNGEGNSVLSPEPTFSTSANLLSNVGTYPIEIGGTSSPNYSISYVNGTLTITPRTLIASVGNYQRAYNESNPAFEVIYNGLVGDDDEDVLITKPVATTTATKTSDVGTYQINVSGGNADNYQFSYNPGTLTINKAEQTIFWNQDLSSLEVGDQVELQAQASSGLPITYTMDADNAAEIYSAGNKTYLDCVAESQFVIRAVQNGNSNYYSSPRTSKSVSIVGSNSQFAPTLTIKQADNGTISMQVSSGKTYTFTIAPFEGWKIHSVMFNNSDVTNMLSDGNKYTTPTITGDSWLSVVYERIDEDAISFISESNVKILGTLTGARVIDAEIGDIVSVYTTDGKLQHTIEVDSQAVDIPLEKGGIYIIQVGAKTVKLGL